MKFIKPSFEIFDQPNTFEDSCKIAEIAGRTCYHSCDKITEDSYKGFIDNLIAHNHGAPLEHCTVYLSYKSFNLSPIFKYDSNPFSKVVYSKGTFYITTNLRVLVENGWMDDLKHWCAPNNELEKRISVHFTCNRQVSHEFVRHRAFSFAQESTRYCNYSKDKFGNELTFIKPCWIEDLSSTGESYTLLENHLKEVEVQYFNLLKEGWKPQQAATILPNALKTELFMTGNISDWKHFFNLRALGTTGAPHPQAKELAEPLYQEFIKRGLIENKQDA